ncbi:hypothetical protein P3L10_029566 [Capsicum annuum]
MSAGGAFGGNRGVRPVPLEKGVFPLDHMHLCDQKKKVYLNFHTSEGCRHLSEKSTWSAVWRNMCCISTEDMNNTTLVLVDFEFIASHPLHVIV